ncbi:MAG: ABC transporter transmembrane domain-containing protein, partial [Pseudomonadota bacterium]
MTTEVQPQDADRIESADGGILVSIARVFKLLGRSELTKWRPIMALSILLTLVAAVLEVISPLLIGHAINQVDDAIGGTAGALTNAVLFIILGIAIRFMAAGLPQVRDWLFSPVSQDAQRVACVDAFGHAQSLSLGFHQTRRTGALNRVIERGASAIDYLIRFLAFNIGPTMVRLVLAAVALGIAFDIRLSLIAVAAVVLYVIATVIITEWRVRQRRKMNVADTRFRGIAVDILTNFETVKSFAAEARETDRFSDAMRNYNSRYVDAIRSMYVLNFVQALIMNLGLFGVLALSAWNVVEGRMEIGDVTAAMLMLLSLYAPLNILGWAWREIKQGAVDLEKLYGL